MPGVLNGVIMVFLLSISTFVIPKLLGGGQYVLVGNLIESQFISVGDWNFASAISLLLAGIILIFMKLMKKLMYRRTKAQMEKIKTFFSQILYGFMLCVLLFADFGDRDIFI